MIKSTVKPSSTKPTKTPTKPKSTTPTKSPASVTTTTPTKTPDKSSVATPVKPVAKQTPKPVVKEPVNPDPKTTPQPSNPLPKEAPKPVIEQNSLKPVKQVANDIETKVMKEKQENQPTNLIKSSTDPVKPNGKPVTKPSQKPVVSETRDPKPQPDTNATSKEDPKKVLFAWTPEGAEKVQISGSFNDWKEKLDMTKNGDKHELSIPLNPGKYSFKFIVDGEWCYDFTAPNECDEEGNVNNVITV